MNKELEEINVETQVNYFKDEEKSIAKYNQELLDVWFRDYADDKITSFEDFFSKNIRKESQEQWVQTEGVLRITQSMINLLTKCNSGDLLKYTSMFKAFLDKSTIPQNYILQQLFNVIGPLLNVHFSKYDNCLYTFDWTKHRNTCIVLICLLDIISQQSANHEIRCQLFEYFLWIIEEVELIASHWDTVYYAVIGVQKIVLRFGMYRERLVEAFDKMILFSEDLCPVESEILNAVSSKNCQFDSFKYQVVLCSTWFVDNILKKHNVEIFNFPVKISTNKLSARCSDNAKFHNVFSKYIITKGIFFYEIVIITDGKMRIGWNCNFDRPGAALKLGSDKHSIAFDGCKKQVWHNSDHDRVDIKSWRAGDVIGCLIEINEEKDYYFAFYLNGTLIPYKMKTSFDNSSTSKSFQPSATLYTGQQCSFNFGPQFKKLPKDYPFVQKYSSADNVENFHLYSKARENVNSISEIIIEHYCDNTQKFQDIVIGQWLCNSKEKIYSGTFHLKNEKDKINQLLRLSQSIVNLVNENQANLYEFNFNLYEIFFTQENREFLLKIIPLMMKMFEPLFNFDIQKIGYSKKIIVKLRNLCLILLLILYNINYSYEEKSDNPCLYELLHFLLKIIENLEHQETVLYAVMCLELFIREIRIDLETKERIIQGLTHLKKHKNQWHSFVFTCKPENLMNLIIKNSEELIMLDNYQCHFSFTDQSKQLEILLKNHFSCPNCDTSENSVIGYQVGFFASSFLNFMEHLYDLKNIQAHRDSELKFSSDSFSISSELYNKLDATVFSAYQIKFYKEMCNSYFYETVILSNGPMKIGWKTENEIFFGLDLYRSMIVHNNQNVKIENLPERYDVGNVIGCLIRIVFQKVKFSFYLNGREIDGTLFDEFNSSSAYYAAVLLENFSHCDLNFGQVPFKYPLTDLSLKNRITDFHSITYGVHPKYQLKFKQPHPNSFQVHKIITADIENISTVVNNEQSIFHQLIDLLESNKFDRHFLKKLSKLENSDIIHLMKSIIYHSDINFPNSKIEIFVGWINSFVSLSEFNNTKKFIEKLMKKVIVNERKMCIVLWILEHIKPKQEKMSFKDYYEEIVSFVFKVLVKSSDNWCRLAVIYSLHQIYSFEAFRKTMRNNEKILNKLDELADAYNHTNFYVDIDPVLIQVQFCAQHFFQSNSYSYESPQIKYNCTLSPYKNMDLVLSNDRFSVRNFNCADVKNINSSLAILTSGIYFYETVIQTSGFMQIGWNMTQSDSSSTTQSNSPKYRNAILLDLFSKCIWNCKKRSIVTNCANWNAGDVIGCLIELEFTEHEDFNEKTQNDIILKDFMFYLNGTRIRHEELELGGKINTSCESVVFAAIRLDIYQQCYCNFGQCEFRFPPKGIVFKTFQEINQGLQVLEVISPEYNLAVESSISFCQACGQNRVYRNTSCEHLICGYCSKNICNICVSSPSFAHINQQLKNSKTTLEIKPLEDEGLEIKFNATSKIDLQVDKTTREEVRNFAKRHSI